MRAGRWSCSMTCAMVKVLPEPVTPRRVWSVRPFLMPSVRALIAVGWSPAGVNSDSMRKGFELSKLSATFWAAAA